MANVGKFDHFMVQLQGNIDMAKGEIYKFAENGKKCSAKAARDCLLNIMKSSKLLRAELQEVKKGMPTRKRILSEETKNKMALARSKRKAQSSKTPEKTVKPVEVKTAAVKK